MFVVDFVLGKLIRGITFFVSNLVKITAPSIAHVTLFLRNRKNKDNLWNLIMGLVLVLGANLSLLFRSPIPLCWSLVPLVVLMYLRRVRFEQKDDEYLMFNKEGQDITTNCPRPFKAFIALGITVIITSCFSDKKLGVFVIVSSFMFAPFLYFILINLPASVLFNFKYLSYLSKKYAHANTCHHHGYKSNSDRYAFDMMKKRAQEAHDNSRKSWRYSYYASNTYRNH